MVKDKSYAFALRIVKLYKYIGKEHKEFTLSKQILRSGTSVGANVAEAIGAESKADFIHKLSISLKEALETSFWLHLLKDSGYIPEKAFQSMEQDCQELIKILRSIILTTKKRK